MKLQLRLILIWTGATALLLVITQTVLASDASGHVVLSPAFSSFALFGVGACATVFSLVQKGYREIKPVLDRVFAMILLVAALPLMLVIGILVKLTSAGPILFAQTRVGENRRRAERRQVGTDAVQNAGRRRVDHCGRLFTVYKFRTMYVDAESTTGPVWARRNDPRVTPLGRFLRKTHLDELPQIINVLRGEMSLVGPRPERPYFVRQLKDKVAGYRNRLTVKPGITGLAQIRHEYDQTLHDVSCKIAWDRLYVAKQSLFVDMSILLATVRVAVVGKPSLRQGSRSSDNLGGGVHSVNVHGD